MTRRLPLLSCLLAMTPLCFAQVVFTEDFEEPTLDEMAARWSTVVNLEGMSFSSDVPPISPGRQSLKSLANSRTRYASFIPLRSSRKLF